MEIEKPRYTQEQLSLFLRDIKMNRVSAETGVSIPSLISMIHGKRATRKAVLIAASEYAYKLKGILDD